MSTKTKEIKWFGMKLTPKQKEKIKKLAKQRGVSQKEAVMELVDEAVKEEPVKSEPGSILERNKDLFGQGNSGRSDVSTNPKYMEGFGQ